MGKVNVIIPAHCQEAAAAAARPYGGFVSLYQATSGCFWLTVGVGSFFFNNVFHRDGRNIAQPVCAGAPDCKYEQRQSREHACAHARFRVSVFGSVLETKTAPYVLDEWIGVCVRTPACLRVFARAYPHARTHTEVVMWPISIEGHDLCARACLCGRLCLSVCEFWCVRACNVRHECKLFVFGL
jgi:hypothetical protein